MDTKTIIVTLVCAVLGSSALTAVVNAVVGAIQKKRGKATTQETHLAEIDKKLGKMQEHQDEQYLAILRLTIMSEEMPMAERLIAGEKYKKMGGNGDVKKFLHQLEAQCGHSNGQEVADLQRARQPRAHHRLRGRRRSDGDHACGAGRNNVLQRLLPLESQK